MKRTLVLAASMVLISMMAHAGPAEVSAAKKAITSTLKDPSSVQFADIYERRNPNADGKPTPAVCGAFNAKNSLGGYVGLRQFVYLPSMRKLLIGGIGSETDQRLAILMIERFCL